VLHGEAGAYQAFRFAFGDRWRFGLSVLARMLDRMLEEAWVYDELVRRMVETLHRGVDDLLRRAGVVLPPTVYVFAEDLDPPFVCSVQCRRFYRGADAAAAVAELGELPSALAATRLLVAWEEQDLKLALGLPADPDTTALVALDATLTDRTLHRRPFRLAGAVGGASPGLVPERGELQRLVDPALPGPVARLLAVWQQWRNEDLNDTVIRLQTAGHRVGWADSYSSA